MGTRNVVVSSAARGSQARLAFESARYFTGVRAGVTVPRGSALAQGLDALAPSMARGGVQVDALAVPRAEWERA